MPRKRKENKKYHIIYKTTCIITNRYYIGMHSTDILEDGYLGSGKRLRYSIRKYGEDKHIREILKFCETYEEMIKEEKDIVNDDLLNDIFCMNLTEGGLGGTSIKNGNSSLGGQAFALKLKTDDEFNKKFRKKVSERLKKTHKEKKINYCTFKGKKHSEETKKKIGEINSIKQKGKRNSQFGTCWIYNLKLKENKKIKKEELEPYISNGWKKGMKKDFFKK